MLESAYRAWLELQGKEQSTLSTSSSMIRRIEAAYGNLEAAFATDGLEGILSELAEHGVSLRGGARDIAITPDCVTFTDQTGEAHSVPADTVIVAKGATGDLTLAEALRASGLAVSTIGDANGVGYIEGAIRDAADAVKALA